MDKESSIVFTRKKEKLLKPTSSGIFERIFVIAGGVSIAWTFAATAPIASVCALGMIGLSFIREIQEFQHPEKTKALEEILNARTVKHPSIWECRKTLKAQYPIHAINSAIEAMIGNCHWYSFKPSDKHYLSRFGECYCYVDPHDGEVLLPIHGLEKLLSQWQVEPTVDVSSVEVEQQQPALPVSSNNQTVAIAKNPTPVGISIASIPTNAAEVLARLEVECPQLLLLVKAPPIRLVGKQRTGKSTFGRKLALLRSVLLPGHQVAWATPHREADNPVPETLNPFGTIPIGGKNFGAIEAVWGAVQDAIDKGQQLNLTAVWDEFGSYDQFEDVDLLSKSLRSLLRESTKHGYHPLLVAHGDQASFYPGVTGILGTLKESTVKVETIGRVVDSFGTMAPTGEVEVTHLDGSQVRFTVPEWLTVDLLLSLQSSMTRPAVLDAIAKAHTPTQETEEKQPLVTDTFNAAIPKTVFEPESADLFEASEIEVKPDIFTEFTKTLTHECQKDLKNFVLWLSKKRGEQVTFDQIKSNWAKNANVSRSKEVLTPLIQVAKSQRLLTAISDSSWKVSE